MWSPSTPPASACSPTRSSPAEAFRRLLDAALDGAAVRGELARAQKAQGADVIYAAAGGTGIGVLQAAADALRARQQEYVPLVIAETGCTATVGRTMQVPQAATRFERYATGALEPSVIPLPPQEMPATGALMGTPASIRERVEPQTVPMEEEPLDSRTSAVQRIT